MGGEDNLWITGRFDRFEQMIGRIGKAGERIRIQHQAALRRQCRQHKIADTFAHAGPRPDHARVQAFVRQQIGELGLGVDGADHHRRERGSVDRKRVPRRGQRDQPRPCPQRSPRRQSRGAGRGDVAGDDDGMSAGVFVAVDPRHRKGLAPKSWNILESQGADLVEHAGIDTDVGETHPAAMNPSRQQQVPRLAAEKRDGFGGAHRDAHHRARGAVDAAGKIDTEDGHPARIDQPR